VRHSTRRTRRPRGGSKVPIEERAIEKRKVGSQEPNLRGSSGFCKHPTGRSVVEPFEVYRHTQFRRALFNRVFEAIEILQETLTEVMEPYWRDPSRLRSLTGYAWWVEAVESLGHQ
jgi:hypothetical protein